MRLRRAAHVMLTRNTSVLAGVVLIYQRILLERRGQLYHRPSATGRGPGAPSRRFGLPSMSALLHRFFGAREVKRAVYQRDVGKRLWEISEQALRHRVILLAEQAEVVTQRKQPVEKRARIRKPLLQDIGIDQPEAAGEKPPLPRRQAVIGVDLVAADETIDQEALLDRLQRAEHTRFIRRQESDRGQEQQAGVELLRSVGLHKASKFQIEAPPAHLVVDFRRHRPPALYRPFQSKFFRTLDRPVEGYPSHHFRISEMPRRASYFPDALIRLGPDPLDVLEQRQLHGPARFAGGPSEVSRLMQRIHALAEYVELQLFERGVADAHRDRAFVARQPRHLPFGKPPLAGDAVHDLDLLRAAGNGAQKPFTPGQSLVAEAGIHQRQQREVASRSQQKR